METKDLIILVSAASGVVMLLIIAVVAIVSYKFCCMKNAKPRVPKRNQTNLALAKQVHKQRNETGDNSTGKSSDQTRSVREEQTCHKGDTYVNVTRNDSGIELDVSASSGSTDDLADNTHSGRRLDVSVHIYDELGHHSSSGIVLEKPNFRNEDEHGTRMNFAHRGENPSDQRAEPLYAYTRRIGTGAEVTEDTPSAQTGDDIRGRIDTSHTAIYLTARNDSLRVDQSGDVHGPFDDLPGSVPRVNGKGPYRESSDGYKESLYDNPEEFKRVRFGDIGPVDSDPGSLVTKNAVDKPRVKAPVVNGLTVEPSGHSAVNSELFEKLRMRKRSADTTETESRMQKKDVIHNVQTNLSDELKMALKRRQDVMKTLENGLID